MHWRQRESLSGANTLTLGILYEVLLTWFGLRAEWVLAGDATFVDERPAGDSSAAVERPDAVFVTAGLENGGLASLTFSSNAGGAGETAVSAYGTGASLHWTAGPPSSEGGNLTLRRAPGWTDEKFEPDPAATWRVEADFIAAVRSGTDGNPNWDWSTCSLWRRSSGRPAPDEGFGRLRSSSGRPRALRSAGGCAVRPPAGSAHRRRGRRA